MQKTLGCSSVNDKHWSISSVGLERGANNAKVLGSTPILTTNVLLFSCIPYFASQSMYVTDRTKELWCALHGVLMYCECSVQPFIRCSELACDGRSIRLAGNPSADSMIPGSLASTGTARGMPTAWKKWRGTCSSP